MSSIADAKAAAVKARGWLAAQGIKSRHVRSHSACAGAFVEILVPEEFVDQCREGLKPVMGTVRFSVFKE